LNCRYTLQAVVEFGWGGAVAGHGRTFGTRLIELTEKGAATVQLIGFGLFSTGSRAARTGRNPAIGAETQIAAAKTMKFVAGQAFKEAVNRHWRLAAAAG
jgi:DNA-binding protein HU-beta